MKKTTPKSTKSPASAKKATSSTAMPVKATVRRAILVQPVAPTPVATTITALIDVGFGNTLFIRGDGPGLSWDKGVPLDSAADDKWTITLPESGRPVLFKFLVNDISWSAGEDFTVAPGTSISVTPVF